MRLALIATAAAAAIAVPLAVAAGGPQMTSDQFLSAVRCTAYEDATGGHVAEAKYLLNAEARHQPAETAALARAEASTIARQAARSGEFDAPGCDQTDLAAGPGSQAGA
jgi:hypothetical protein